MHSETGVISSVCSPGITHSLTHSLPRTLADEQMHASFRLIFKPVCKHHRNKSAGHFSGGMHVPACLMCTKLQILKKTKKPSVGALWLPTQRRSPPKAHLQPEEQHLSSRSRLIKTPWNVGSHALTCFTCTRTRRCNTPVRHMAAEASAARRTCGSRGLAEICCVLKSARKPPQGTEELLKGRVATCKSCTEML